MSLSLAFVGQSGTPVPLVFSRLPDSSLEAAKLDGVGKTPSPVVGTTNVDIIAAAITDHMLEQGDMHGE